MLQVPKIDVHGYNGVYVLLVKDELVNLFFCGDTSIFLCSVYVCIRALDIVQAVLTSRGSSMKEVGARQCL